MQELIDKLPRFDLNNAKNLYLFDTCFLINLFEKSPHPRINFDFAMTSFNAQELMHNIHKIKPFVKDNIRNYLKSANNISILELPIDPGDWKGEKEFVRAVDSALLMEIPDASDAVLIAAAITTNSNIFTKDRHHLYTAMLGNFLQRYNIKVWKELKDKDKKIQ
jgi:hypothetical protein